MAVGVAVATIAAALIGALIVRRRGVYFAMVTIAFGQVFYFIAFRWNTVTGGDDGLTGWHRMPIDLGFTELDIYGKDKAFYYFALAIFAVCVGIMALLLASPFGRTLLAIRENERRARFLGIPIERHIWLSFVISCVFVSVAGSLYALLNNFTDPRALRFDLSGNFVIMAVLGGMRSFWGPLIGAADFRRAAGLCFQPHRELDVGDRPRLRARRQVFPARRSRGLPRQGGGMSLLKVDTSRKHFGSLIAVDGVSLAIEPGELRAIIGPNGAGKTTFFNLISGFFAPTSGAIKFGDEDISALSPEARVARGMARTFQITEIFPELGVADNLRIAVEVAAGYGLRPWIGRVARAEVDDARRRTAGPGRFDGQADLRVGALSHGDQRATEIMMSLALRPRLLCSTNRQRAWATRKPTTSRVSSAVCTDSEGLTIMLIEHDMRVVFNLADRIMVLAEGTGSGGRRRRRRSPGARRCRRPIWARRRHDRASRPRGCTPSTARATSCTGCRSRCARARSSRCSAATARARPRRCAA